MDRWKSREVRLKPDPTSGDFVRSGPPDLPRRFYLGLKGCLAVFEPEMTSLHRRLVGQRALDRFFGRLVVVVVDLLVVLRVPVNEHADHDAVVIDLVARDDAALDRVDHGAGHRRLGGAEHLHGLLRALDGDLVEEDGVGLRGQVRRDDRQKSA